VSSVLAIPTLITERLILRPYRLADFDAYAAMWANPIVTRFIGGVPFTREQSWTRFLRQVGLWYHLGFGFFAIEEKATGRLGGECGFHDLHRAIEPSIEGTMEAGWGLIPALHGRGLAEEAMRSALEWAEQFGSRDRLTCLIHPDNAPSLRLAHKLRFEELARTIYAGTPAVLLGRPRRQ
jgi:RimJ/RimL family protein N-acetyltransferase